jgi:MFS family permease
MSTITPLMTKKYLMRAYIVCFSAALFFFYEFIQGNLFGSISQDMMQAFAITADKMVLLSSIYFVANVVFLFPAGVLLDRYSTKKIILISLSVCIFGTFLLASTSSFEVALLCRFLTGIGSAFCFLSSIRLASRWFPTQKMALITGLIVTMAMTGGMVAQAPMTLLINAYGWREALLFDAGLGLVILLVISKTIQDWPHGRPLRREDSLHGMSIWQSMRQSYFKAQNLLAALYTSLMNMPIAILGAMIGSLYLEQTFGLSRQDASMVTSMIFFGAILGAPVIGNLSDKLALRKKPMIVFNLLSLVSICYLIYQPNPSFSLLALLFFLVGFFTSAQVISYPLIAENNPPALTATAVSVASILTQGGYVLYQNIFGQLLQSGWQGKTLAGVAQYSPSAYQYALTILPIGAGLAFIACCFLKETHCKRVGRN